MQDGQWPLRGRQGRAAGPGRRRAGAEGGRSLYCAGQKDAASDGAEEEDREAHRFGLRAWGPRLFADQPLPSGRWPVREGCGWPCCGL